jgi:hypothetical protein
MRIFVLQARYLVAALICAVLTHPAFGQTSGCDALLRNGVFDTRIDTNSSEFEANFQHYFCSKASKGSGGDNNGNLWVNIPGVVEFGGGSANSSIQNELNEICTSTSDWSKLSSDTKSYISTASKVLVDGFNKCMGSQGLHSTVVFASDPKDFFIALSYVGSGVDGDKTFLTVKSNDPKNATCRIPKGTKIKNKPSYFRCEKNVNANSSSVLIYFNGGITSTPLIAPPAYTPWTPTTVGPGYLTTSEGWRLNLDQMGRTVTWQLDSPAIYHQFIGRFVSPDRIQGTQTRTIKSTGCRVKQFYDMRVVAPYKITGSASLHALRDQPNGSFCDFDSEPNWGRDYTMIVTPTLD